MVKRFWVGVSASLLALAGMVGAAGYSIYEQGAAATAQAGAFAARASDPSAVFYNPAGIARQKAGIEIGTTLIFTSTEFEGGAPLLGIPNAKHEMEPGMFYPSRLLRCTDRNTWTTAIVET